MKKVSRHPLLFGTVALVFSATALYGCKDFLSRAAAPQGTLNEQTLATQDGVEGSLIAAYRAMDANSGVGGWGNSASNWVWGSVASDDAYKGSEASDQPPINDIEAYHWSTADAESYLNDKWRGMYEGIVRANATIRLLDEVAGSNPSLISQADQDGIRGESLFLRAHYHFEAWRMWGSIPYYKEDDKDFRKANESMDQGLTDILADLDAAITLLPAGGPRNGDKGRVWQKTAQAYKGRVQVYKASYSKAAPDWAAAQATLRGVVTSATYALQQTYDQVWSGFQSNSNGPETIFAYQASVNDGEPSGWNSNWGERLNFPHSGSYFGCCGFHQPSQNLVNYFRVDGNGLPLALSSSGTWNASNTTFIAGNMATVDPRLDWTVGRDGVPYKDWGIHTAGWIRAPAYGGRYSPKKNIHEHASGAESNVGWVPSQTNSVNIHLFRYADLLLMLAEADVEVGGAADLTEALTIVNSIRTRARAGVQGCGTPSDPNLAGDELTALPGCAGDSRMVVPINDASITWASYRVDNYPAAGWTQAYAREAVRAERHVELAMEGQRFFDIKRWGIADQVINGYLDGVGGGNESSRQLYLPAADRWTGGATDKHYFFPIPAVQIELSKVGSTPQLTQNAGW